MAQKTLKIAKRIFKLDKSTGELVWELVNPTSVKWSGTSDTVEVKDGMGTLIESYEKDVNSSLECSSAIVDLAVIADQNGTEVKITKNGSAVKLIEKHTVTGQKVITNHKATGVTGNEIGFIYEIKDGERVKSYTQGASASTTEFAYNPINKTITMPTGNVIPDGTIIQVIYSPLFKEYKEIIRKTDEFTDTGMICVDGLFRDTCTKKDEPMQLQFPNGKINANFDYTFGEQTAVTNVKIDSQLDACGTENTTWRLVSYDTDKVQG